MEQIKEKIKQRTAQAMNLSVEELENIIHADESCLHDPFLYTNMDILVDKLHAFKQHQAVNPADLLIVDTDYDTDGVMSACVLAASLDVFNINFKVHIPTMENGYGLSINDINALRAAYPNRIHTILTADNGTNAIEGVKYAKELGYQVLVTDHHLGGETLANADVIVNPNQPTDTYPFKGNAGATVAWKAMLAYAIRYEPDKLDLIKDLIVFAGMANVADVMPIIDENHYMVKVAVEQIKSLRQNPLRLPSTPYQHYNNIFQGLVDLINQTQTIRDQKRALLDKKPSPLPTDEELISWYISPMLNAPRRVHATCREAMLALLADKQTRFENVIKLNDLNAQKTQLKDEAMSQVQTTDLLSDSNTAVVDTRHGIVGLVAGTLAENTGNATIVFTTSENLLVGSARSNDLQPLHVIFNHIHQIDPTIIAGGGGHANAAGYAIYKDKLHVFKHLFNDVAARIRTEMLQMAMENADNIPPQNVILLSDNELAETKNYLPIQTTLVNFTELANYILEFQKSLKPFGAKFNGQIKFFIELDPEYLQSPEAELNLNFWGGKTLKFKYHGVEVLTFSTEVAQTIKDNLFSPREAQVFQAELKENEFMGNVKPQLLLTKQYKLD